MLLSVLLLVKSRVRGHHTVMVVVQSLYSTHNTEVGAVLCCGVRWCAGVCCAVRGADFLQELLTCWRRCLGAQTLMPRAMPALLPTVLAGSNDVTLAACRCQSITHWCPRSQLP